MKKQLLDKFDLWPYNFIRDKDLVQLLGKTDEGRYAFVKRALKSGFLLPLRKGLYLIARKTKQPFPLPDEFALAPLIYHPSVISLQSALSYHGLIPEAVYTTTSVTPKRAQEFENYLGLFVYKHVPAASFYQGVSRIVTHAGILLIADPWKALADFIYVNRKSWDNLLELELDLRIDPETIAEKDRELLKVLSEEYPSTRVRVQLKKFLRDILKNYKVAS